MTVLYSEQIAVPTLKPWGRGDKDTIVYEYFEYDDGDREHLLWIWGTYGTCQEVDISAASEDPAPIIGYLSDYAGNSEVEALIQRLQAGAAVGR